MVESGDVNIELTSVIFQANLQNIYHILNVMERYYSLWWALSSLLMESKTIYKGLTKRLFELAVYKPNLAVLHLLVLSVVDLDYS